MRTLVEREVKPVRVEWEFGGPGSDDSESEPDEDWFCLVE